LWEKYQDQDFLLWGIDSGDSYETVTNWLNNLGGVSYPILLDQSQAVLRTYNIQCTDSYAPYPRQVIIDQDGIVQYTACQYYPDRVIATIDALLAE
jgi:alkyl hydroperoxide reductase subunit AhpC